MAAGTKFYCFLLDSFHKNHDLESDQLRLALTNVAPAVTDTVLGDLTEIAYTFCSSRNVTVSSSAQVAGLYKLVCDDVTLAASGGSVGPFRYAVLYNTVNGKLIAFWDRGASITLLDGESVPADFDGVNGVFQAGP